MKNLVLLFLSVIVVFLSAMPCCAIGAEVVANGKEVKAISQEDNCQEDCCGTCSPFFSCSSCLHFGEAKQIAVKYSAPAGLNIQHQDGYLQGNPILVLIAIWQPPKV